LIFSRASPGYWLSQRNDDLMKRWGNLVLGLLLTWAAVRTIVEGRISRWAASQATGPAALLVGLLLLVLATVVFADYLKKMRNSRKK
jgi:hypothetical protein